MRAIGPALLFLPYTLLSQVWPQLPDFPGTPRDDAAAFAINGIAYVGSGLGVGWALESDWYRYDYNAVQWTPIAPLPASPRQYCTAFVVGDTGYVFGGSDSTGALNELWAYSPMTDTWQQKAPMPAAGRYASCSPYPGYVACGQFDPTSATNELWFYEASTDQWYQKSPLPGTSRHRAAGTYEQGSYGYVLGGADSAWTPLADCWRYDALNDAWATVTDLPEPRFGGSAMMSTYYGLTYLFGVTTGGNYLASGLHLDNAAWVPSEPIPGTRKGAVAIAGYGPVMNGGGGYFFDYFGTGMDSTLFRKNDWWGFGFEEGIVELATGVLRIHPNPGTNMLNIALPDLNEVQLIVRDARGAVVRMERTFGPTTIDMSDQPLGLYTVEALSAGFRARARWIKL